MFILCRLKKELKNDKESSVCLVVVVVLRGQLFYTIKISGLAKVRMYQPRRHKQNGATSSVGPHSSVAKIRAYLPQTQIEENLYRVVFKKETVYSYVGEAKKEDDRTIVVQCRRHFVLCKLCNLVHAMCECVSEYAKI